jgi:CheY-like chemotaxis protein
VANAKTVLVVEDNRVQREALAALLRQDRYEVVAAANGKEALDRLKGKPPPDVLLLDMMMSEIDGWQLLKLLRHYPGLMEIPVIIVTGLEIANLEWALSLGAAGLVRKPVELDHLRNELARALKG